MKYIVALFFVLFSIHLGGQSYWSNMSETVSTKNNKSRWIVPQKYRALDLDRSNLEKTLGQLNNKLAVDEVEIKIPLPDGTSDTYLVQESSVMAPGLAAKFPEIKTYRGLSATRPGARITMDLTPAGFHAMLSSDNGTVYIDPYFKGDDSKYVAYYKKDFVASNETKWSCGFENSNTGTDVNIKKGRAQKMMATIQLRTYRLAVSATGEYTAFHGGTVALAQAAIVTAINRVNEIYEQELAVTMQLVTNNDQIIYTNATTDPFTDGDGDALVLENQSNTDQEIGNANYDVGHNFGLGEGGLAGLGVVCLNAEKAEGQTGLSDPTGDPFYIDFVSHELGHQFAGNHTFNGSVNACEADNRNGDTAYEPGSGSTIQAYAGICADQNTDQNLQGNSDAYFHLASLNEMRAHIESNSTCGVKSGTNMKPVANANIMNINSKSIPASTPFELTGSGTDADNDALTYCWEQWNLGPQGDINAASTSAPIFRSFLPVASPTRIFPKLSDILNNTTTYGEVLPTVGRSLTFQLTVRDDNAIGGYDSDSIGLTVVGNTGPFKINAPNTASTESGVTAIAWDIAGTDVAPINCNTIDVFLSTDGGQTFGTTVATSLPNTGSASITLPNLTSSTARLKIKCSDNVFFDINDTNFSISPSSGPLCSISAITAGTTSNCNPADDTYTQELTVIYTNPPATGSLVVNGQSFIIGMSPQVVTLVGLQSNGTAVDAVASFSNLGTCTLTIPNAFTAAATCQSTTSGCEDHVQSNLTLAITNAAPVTSSVMVTQSGTITDVNIKNLKGTHAWVADIKMMLKNVTTGTEIILFDALCDNGNQFQNYDLNLDDEGIVNFNCPPTDMMTYKPQAFFSAFNGEMATGMWELTISDGFADDDGVLTDWTLEICTSGGGNNPCDNNALTVTDNPIPSGTYKSDGYVSSASNVAMSSNVIFRAPDSINLKPSFMTSGGGVFEAQIGDCDN